MLVDLSLLVIGRLRECGPGFGKQLLPPAHFFDAGIIDVSGPVKSLDHSLPGLFVLPLHH